MLSHLILTNKIVLSRLLSYSNHMVITLLLLCSGGRQIFVFIVLRTFSIKDGAVGRPDNTSTVSELSYIPDKDIASVAA